MTASVWTRPAIDDLASIHRCIASDDRPAADRVQDRVTARIEHLSAYPLIGRPGRVAETRERIVPGLPYIGVYRLADERQVRILRVLHRAREYP